MKKYILLLFLGITFTLNAQNEIRICVPLAPQEQSTWCGVAASQCVLRYSGTNVGPYVPQCKIMDYVRKETLSYGIVDCCEDVNQGCNAGGIDLYGGKGTVQAILSHFGEVNSVAHFGTPPFRDRIIAYLSNDRPLIISLKNQYYGDQHAVVVYGIDVGIGSSDYIYFMDPAPVNEGTWDKEKYNDLIFGSNIPFYWFNTLVIGDALYPDHCFNGVCDEDEDDIDCGGSSCEPCKTSPPPPSTCSNCRKDEGEVQIDCGGEDCPPCEDVPEERIIENSHNLPSEVMAFKKITAGKYQVWVKPGQNVSFITEETGSIILLPGFSAQKGSNFRTQRKDLSGYSRICPEELCSTAQFLSHITGSFSTAWFGIYNLLYAVKIEYEIYDEQGRFIYGDVIDVAHNGSVRLWNCLDGAIITEGSVTYNINCTVHYCNGAKHNYNRTFVVTRLSKSSNSDSDEPETPPQFSPPPPNNTLLHSATAPPQFTITPNPNPGTFHLQTNFPFTDIAHLKIITSIGATLYETQALYSNTIQLPTFATGQHFVVIMLKDGAVLTQKMMIQR